ncbi:putative TetR/AcrR family transcriptional regulator [uncultured Thiomicrorhabdus sp.]|jgi:AcrR family transcriptional regulator
MTKVNMSSSIESRISSRKRLPTDVRIQSILDSALREFTKKGFFYAKVDDIAKGAGLSKGGFYNYFQSKEALFEALLKERIPFIELDAERLLFNVYSVEKLVEVILEPFYNFGRDESALSAFRLLISENTLLSEEMENWKIDYVHSLNVGIESVLHKAVELGICRENILMDRGWLVLSPIVDVSIQLIIFGNKSRKSLEEFYEDHKMLLIELLRT